MNLVDFFPPLLLVIRDFTTVGTCLLKSPLSGNARCPPIHPLGPREINFSLVFCNIGVFWWLHHHMQVALITFTLQMKFN